MRKIIAALVIVSTILSCRSDDDGQNETEYKQKMRDFVIGISEYAKSANPDFMIIPQNGIELVSDNGASTGNPHTAYLNAIDGNGQEDLFYGYNSDDEASPNSEISYLKELLNISKNKGKTILVTDYCSTLSKINDSYQKNNASGYVSFAATQRDLNVIPTIPNPIHNENSNSIKTLSDVKNFLYLINLENYPNKASFITAVSNTNYDLIIMDLFAEDGTAFTSAEISQLKIKKNGAQRKVVAYMSVGEAENYRYYWNSVCNSAKPGWLLAENPDWPGNYKVKYWDSSWQSIIFGNQNSYLQKIMDAGFDGAYLDIIDGFEYFED